MLALVRRSVIYVIFNSRKYQAHRVILPSLIARKLVFEMADETNTRKAVVVLSRRQE